MPADTGTVLEGGCTCGGLRYRLIRAPLFVHGCHCTWCQRETGAAFAVNALIETEAIELVAGAPVRAALPSPSGNGQVFIRCSGCGLTLWSHYSGMGEQIAFVRAGTLDPPHAVAPDIHIYTSTKRPWVILPEGVPAVADYYRRSEHWPAESLERLRALRSR